jgi:predicted lipoprotein with Yx(FWY)xxD motif
MKRLSPTRSLIALALAGALMGGCASMSNAPAMASNGVLTSPNGMTLYTFDRDAAGSGKSACNGPCATNWPPLMAAAGAQSTGDYTIVVRNDGTRQWAHKGHPLYYWIKDAKAGDRTGDGVNNVWHLARP